MKAVARTNGAHTQGAYADVALGTPGVQVAKLAGAWVIAAAFLGGP